MNSRPEAVEVLEPATALDLLSQRNFGRLAFAVAGEPDIVPINFLVHDGKVYFRTSEGSKLLGITVNSRVALETDVVSGEHASSVIAHGNARELVTDAELEFAESLGLPSWVPTVKNHIVEITLDDVSARRFRFTAEQP